MIHIDEMPLIKSNINSFLLLKNFHFADFYENIDFLNKKAILETDCNKRLLMLIRATSKVEKFHSFFHFDQSFFHLELACKYFEQNRIEEAVEQLKAAIFQDPLNSNAKYMLEMKKKINFDKQYSRPHNSFVDYISFATMNNKLNKEKCINADFSPYDFYAQNDNISISKDNYWLLWLAYKKNEDDLSILETVIEKIRFCHQGYHAEAAKLYLNRALTFWNLNKHELAKNDVIKASNLDNKIRDKEYYKIIIKKIPEVNFL